MKKIFILLIFSVFLLTSCLTTTGFNDFYKPIYEDGLLPTEGYLKEGEIPVIIQTNDSDSKFREVSSDWYWCIGYSGFNGAELSLSEINKALEKLCIEKKAKLAIWSQKYTDTRNGVISIPYTNYYSIPNSYGYYNSFTTTSYSTSSYSVQRYDYDSYLFVKIPNEYKEVYMPGFSVCDLTQKDRDLYKQNTGCLINIVYKDTIAFYANLLNGDIITDINGTNIHSADDFYKVKINSQIGDIWEITFVRNGEAKKVTLTFGLY